MLNKCVKLILILALVVAVAFGVSFLPFSLSDKFKQVAEKVTSHIKGLAGLNKNAGAKLNLDFSKRDNYKLGEFNVVFDKVNNVPKEGFHKFVHKGENDATLDVEKFFNGETELEGLEGGLFDYAAAYFKGDTPHLLLVELGLHEEEKQENADKAAEKKEGEAKAGENKENAAAEEKKGLVMFFAPGENNKWVKLAEGANLAEKVEEVFNALAAAAAAAPANTTPEGGNGAAAGGAPPAEGAGAAAGAAGPGEGPAPAGVQAGGDAAPAPVPAAPVPAPGPKAGVEGGNVEPAGPGAPTPGAGALPNGGGAGAAADQGKGDTGAKGEAGPAGPNGASGEAGSGPAKTEAAKPVAPDAAPGNPGSTTGPNGGDHAQAAQGSADQNGLRGTTQVVNQNNPQSGGNSNGNNQGGSHNAGDGQTGGVVQGTPNGAGLSGHSGTSGSSAGTNNVEQGSHPKPADTPKPGSVGADTHTSPTTGP